MKLSIYRETNLDGFRLLVRLSRHHPESLRTDLHNININGMRHVMNLRSQVCRSACLFFRELFQSQGKLMEQVKFILLPVVLFYIIYLDMKYSNTYNMPIQCLSVMCLTVYIYTLL